MRIIFHRIVRATVVAEAFALAACTAGSGTVTARQDGSAGTGRGRGAAQQAAVPVAVGVVEQRSVPLELRVIGTAQAYAVVAVHSQITGELTSVNFKEGDDVTEGQVLFTLDRRPLEAALLQARANLERDMAQATNARASAVRYRDLLARGIATKEQTDQSATAAAALEATLGADRAAVENAEVQLQYATITARISGRTGALMVHRGNLVRANDVAALVVINQISPIYVSFGIPEGRLSDLKAYLAQQTVSVEASPPGETRAGSVGHVTFIDNGVDPATGVVTIKAEFPNADRRLWPGQFANVVVTLTRAANAIVVPTAAVQNGQQGDYVFVVKADRTVEFRLVTVERTAGKDVVIRSGLAPGETIVTDGHIRLNAGSRVSIKESGTAAGVAP